MRDGPARIAVAAIRRYVDDGMVDRAPALAYYGVLSLFPLLLLGFSVLRFAGGPEVVGDLEAYARDAGASGAVAQSLRSAAETAREASTVTAGSAGAAGLLALVYGASRAFTATGRAFDVLAGHATPRRTPTRRLQDIAWTLVVLALLLVLVVVIAISGRVLGATLDLFGLGQALDVWRLARWPVIAAVALLLVALVRWTAPTARPRFRLVSPGALVTVGALIAGTVGYEVYVEQLSSYNTTYGTFAGAIILMLWVWLAAIALLFGAEVDAALDDAHQRRGEVHPTPAHRRSGLSARRTGGTVGLRSKAP